MSYCRTSETDSDVYVFGSGTHLECHIAWARADQVGIEEHFITPYTLEPAIAERTMLGHLMFLRTIGLLVPERATDRLAGEIADLLVGESLVSA